MYTADRKSTFFQRHRLEAVQLQANAKAEMLLPHPLEAWRNMSRVNDTTGQVVHKRNIISVCLKEPSLRVSRSRG